MTRYLAQEQHPNDYTVSFNRSRQMAEADKCQNGEGVIRAAALSCARDQPPLPGDHHASGT